jgi:hypothetical protein
MSRDIEFNSRYKPSAWSFLNSVTVLIAGIPAFSANVSGMTSKASANALFHK